MPPRRRRPPRPPPPRLAAAAAAAAPPLLLLATAAAESAAAAASEGPPPPGPGGNGSNPSPVCTSGAHGLQCSACAECCYDWVSNCTECVAERCWKNVCSNGTCNVCAECCWPYIHNGPDCDACVTAECNAPPPPTPVPPRTVCMHNPAASSDTLQKGLDWVCWDGDGDPKKGGHINCTAIQRTGPCFYPEDLKLHCDWAFDTYWQARRNEGATCYFSGAAGEQPAGATRECHVDRTECSPCPIAPEPGCNKCPYTPGTKCCDPILSQVCYYTAAGHVSVGGAADPPANGPSVGVPCCQCGNDNCECPPPPGTPVPPPPTPAPTPPPGCESCAGVSPGTICCSPSQMCYYGPRAVPCCNCGADSCRCPDQPPPLPTPSPTPDPTPAPTPLPTAAPTPLPTPAPTPLPTPAPTRAPPTMEPTPSPTPAPTPWPPPPPPPSPPPNSTCKDCNIPAGDICCNPHANPPQYCPSGAPCCDCGKNSCSCLH